MAKILIVEGDAAHARLYADKFVDENYDVVTTDTARKALHLVKTFHPNVIILDLMLPGGINGFDLLYLLKSDSRLKRIPVVIFTNLDTERKTALSLGAKEYIVKSSSSLGELIKVVKSLTKKRFFIF